MGTARPRVAELREDAGLTLLARNTLALDFRRYLHRIDGQRGRSAPVDRHADGAEYVVDGGDTAVWQAGRIGEVISYSGTKHSFTNPDAASAGIPVALAYNKQTDQRSWKAIVNFFEEIFA